MALNVFMKELGAVEWVDVTSRTVKTAFNTRSGFSSLGIGVDMGKLTVTYKASDLAIASVFHTTAKQVRIEKDGLWVFEGYTKGSASVKTSRSSSDAWVSVTAYPYVQAFREALLKNDLVAYDLKISDNNDPSHSLLHILWEAMLDAVDPIIGELVERTYTVRFPNILDTRSVFVLEAGQNAYNEFSKILGEFTLSMWVDGQEVLFSKPYADDSREIVDIDYKYVIENPAIKTAPHVAETKPVIRMGRLEEYDNEGIYSLSEWGDSDGVDVEAGAFYPEEGVNEIAYSSTKENDSKTFYYARNPMITVKAFKSNGSSQVPATLTEIEKTVTGTGATLRLKNETGQYVYLKDVEVRATKAYLLDKSLTFEADVNGEENEIETSYISTEAEARAYIEALVAEQKAETSSLKFSSGMVTGLKPNQLIAIGDIPAVYLIRQVEKDIVTGVATYHCIMFDLAEVDTDTLYRTGGKRGVRGKSAYQIAVENGFQGTEQEWLDSLKATATPKVVAWSYGVATSETEWNQDTIVADIGSVVAESWAYGLYIWRQAFITDIETGITTASGAPVYDAETQSAYMRTLRFEVAPNTTTYTVNKRSVGSQNDTVIDLSNVVDIGYRCDSIDYDSEMPMLEGESKINVPANTNILSFKVTVYGVKGGERIQATKTVLEFVGVDVTVYNLYFGALDGEPGGVSINGDVYYNKTTGSVMLYENGWIEASDSQDQGAKADAYSKAQKDVLSAELADVTKSEKTVAYYGYFDHMIANTVNAEYVNSRLVSNNYTEVDGVPKSGYKLNGETGVVSAVKANLYDSDIHGSSNFFGNLSIKDDTGAKDLLVTQKSQQTHEEVKVEADSVPYFSLGDMANATSLGLIKQSYSYNSAIPLSSRTFGGTERVGSSAVSWTFNKMMLAKKETISGALINTQTVTLPIRSSVVNGGNLNVSTGTYEAGTVLATTKKDWGLSDLSEANGFNDFISVGNKTYSNGTRIDENSTYDGIEFSGLYYVNDVEAWKVINAKINTTTGKNSENAIIKSTFTTKDKCRLRFEAHGVQPGEGIFGGLSFGLYVNGTRVLEYDLKKDGGDYYFTMNLNASDEVYYSGSVHFVGSVFLGTEIKFKDDGFPLTGLYAKYISDKAWHKVEVGYPHRLRDARYAGYGNPVIYWDTNDLISAPYSVTPAFNTDTIVLMNGNSVVKAFDSSSAEWYTSTLDLDIVKSTQAQVRKGYKATAFSALAGSASQFDSGAKASWTKVSPVTDSMGGTLASASWSPSYSVTVTNTNGVTKSIGANELFSEIDVQFKGISQGKGVTVQNINPETTGSYDIGSSKYPFNVVHANSFEGKATSAGTADSATRSTIATYSALSEGTSDIYRFIPFQDGEGWTDQLGACFTGAFRFNPARHALHMNTISMAGSPTASINSGNPAGWYRLCSIKGYGGYLNAIFLIFGGYNWQSSANAVISISSMHTTLDITKLSGGGNGGFYNLRLARDSDDTIHIDGYHTSTAGLGGSAHSYGCALIGNFGQTVNWVMDTSPRSLSYAHAVTLDINNSGIAGNSVYGAVFN